MANLFDKKCIIGMVHTPALPGTKNYEGDMKKVIDWAVKDAKTLSDACVDALIVENFNDYPMTNYLQLEQVAALAAVAQAVKEVINIPMGIDAAFTDTKASIAIAVAVGADFIRVPVFVDTVVTADGIAYPAAGEAIRYRRMLGGENIQILADIQTKHTHMLSNDVSIEESAELAAESGADAIIVTGQHTGAATPIDTIERVRKVVNIPVMVGSGFSIKNAEEQLKLIDGAIVGSAFKVDGKISNPIDYEKTVAIMTKVNEIRSKL